MRHSSFENDWIAGAPILRLIRFYIGSRHIYMQQAISAAVLLRSGLETLRLEGNPITLEEFCALEGVQPFLQVRQIYFLIVRARKS
jgi:hypothetical protein